MSVGQRQFFFKPPTPPLPQLAYFVAWPTLGSAIILVGMPSDDKLKRDLQRPPGELAAAATAARAAAAAAANAGRKDG